MDTRYRIIQTLSDGRFHSGQTLAEILSVSRAAVWKRLKAFEADLGLQVRAVPGRGYRLEHPIELLEVDALLNAVAADARDRLACLHLFDRLDSTNAHLLTLAAEGAPAGSVCLAEQQIAGRGRRGRRWVSPFGANIYLSILWRYTLAPVQLSGLSLACGLAVRNALEGLGVPEIGLKWPNDLCYDGRKLAGLLLEMSGESGGPTQVVVGLGLNTRLSETQARSIDQPWIDLTQIPGGGGVGRNRLAGALAGTLLSALDTYGRQGLGPLIEDWYRHDIFYGREVVLRQGERELRGLHSGIDPSGALLLSVDGAVRPCHVGELSLRGAPHCKDRE
jgi:BirA family biotin operon repressor/biotin-[acetyl-CoA-carboxylase] ligase